VFECMVPCCPSVLISSCRTAKRLEVAGWFSKYSLSLLCFAFITALLFGDLLRLYDTFVQVSLHSDTDGNALA
jgi:hypothetical protein